MYKRAVKSKYEKLVSMKIKLKKRLYILRPRSKDEILEGGVVYTQLTTAPISFHRERKSITWGTWTTSFIVTDTFVDAGFSGLNLEMMNLLRTL